MKNKLLLISVLLMFSVQFALGQFTTGTANLSATSTVRIDTSPTIVTITLTGLSDRWLGLGFASNTMASVTDMFIWNDSTNRDYTPNTVGNAGHNLPSPDAIQSWTIVSDDVASGTRTVVATRPLVSSGDYTFTNNNMFIQLIYAQGSTTSLAYHGDNPHGTAAIGRFVLALEDFTSNSTSIYPNPSTGIFKIKTNSILDKIIVYSQNGTIVKNIIFEEKKEENEVNLSELSTGIYIFELQNGDEKSWKKVVIN